MKRVLRACVGKYFHAWWLPVTLSILLLRLFVLVFLARPFVPGRPGFLQVSLLLLFGASLLGVFGVFVVATYQLVKRRWLAAGFQFALLIGLLSFLRTGPFFAMLVMGPSEDGFADNLVIPADLAVTEPLEMAKGFFGIRERVPQENADAFQATLIATLADSGTGDPSVTAELPSLAELQKRHPDVLRRYLATSIAWRVFRERRDVFATRRWKVRGVWSYSLHGYYMARDHRGIPRFQTRTTLGLSGRPWAGASSTTLTSGKPVSVRVENGMGQPASSCVLPVEGMAVEIFEQSPAKERRLTKATLRLLDNEFRPLASNPTWETIQKLVPPGSIINGEPSLDLRKSFQPGSYCPEIRVNPGEPGRIYLKAFEVTRGTPLSVSELEEYSNEYVGWSGDPRQQFFSNTFIMIDEGDWEKPYAARFEVWFVPDSGKPERKLLENTFRIEGWQR